MFYTGQRYPKCPASRYESQLQLETYRMTMQVPPGKPVKRAARVYPLSNRMAQTIFRRQPRTPNRKIGVNIQPTIGPFPDFDSAISFKTNVGIQCARNLFFQIGALTLAE